MFVTTSSPGLLLRRFRTLTNLPSSLAPSFAMDSFRRPPQRESWFAPLSVDLILKVLYVTFLHPFVAWMVPLCFRWRRVVKR